MSSRDASESGRDDGDRDGPSPQRPFVSTLSAAAFALGEDLGTTPLTVVMGADVRALWVQLPLPTYRQPPFVAERVPAAQHAEDVVTVDVLDREVTESRLSALARIRDDAVRAGADLVVELRELPRLDPRVPAGGRRVSAALARVRPGPHPCVSRTVSTQLIGTAVRDGARAARAPAVRAPAVSTPALSTLSAAELWRLRRGGLQPVAVVGGCAHRFGASLWAGSSAHEVAGSSAVFAAAHAAALVQLREELSGLGADGAVALRTTSEHELVEWSERVEVLGAGRGVRRASVGRQGVLVSVAMLATAVRRVAAPARPRAPEPTSVLVL